jgi:hypothetical protein
VTLARFLAAAVALARRVDGVELRYFPASP